MNAPPEQGKLQPGPARRRDARLHYLGGRLVDTQSLEFKVEARRQAALLDHSDDELEAAAMMDRLRQEVWDSEP